MLIIQRALVQHLAFVFPELLLVVLAAILLLGRYTGYRLSDWSASGRSRSGTGPT